MLNSILMVSSEAVPLAKSGGLADVAGTLPKAVLDNGYDIRITMPLYKSIKEKYKAEMRKVTTFNVKLDWRNQTANIYEYDMQTEKGNTLKYYLIQNDYYFERDGLYGYDDDGERFVFFAKAVLEMLPKIDFRPEVIHCNDWQTGTLPVMLKEVFMKKNSFYKDMKTLYTIHNLKFQGICGYEFLNMMELDSSLFTPDKLEYYGMVNMMKAGIVYCDKLNTVSETYAKEIQLPQYGCMIEGLLRAQSDKLYGILNGIDNDAYNPMSDTRIWKNYSYELLDNKKENKRMLQQEMGLEVNDDIPVIAIISRITDQKGFDMIGPNIEQLLDLNAQIVVLGTGERCFEEMFLYMQGRNPKKIKANIMFSEELANKIYAGSDMILIPSRFEPCGLTQLISFRYGTVPIVRSTGGLADTVKNYDYASNSGTGFAFKNCSCDELMNSIYDACKLYEDKTRWEALVKKIMLLDYSWNTSAIKYLRLYESMLKKNKNIA